MMKYIKLSALLLTVSGSLVYAEAKKAEPTNAQAKPAENFFEQGKEFASLALSVTKSNEQKAQMEFAQKMHGVLGPLHSILQKSESASDEAKAAWKNFQDFYRGFKQVFDKDTPTAPVNISELEKKSFELSVEATKMSYDTALASKDFAEYTKLMQEKMQELMSKHTKNMQEAAKAASEKK